MDKTKTNYIFSFKRTIFLICFFSGIAPVIFFLYFDFNSYILCHFSINNKPTPSTLYIPQKIITNDSIDRVRTLILGGSSIREFFPMDVELDSILSYVCGNETYALNAGTSSQSLADSAALLDAMILAGAQPDRIVVGLTKFRLSHPWNSWSDVIAGQKVALPISSALTSNLSFFDTLSWKIRDRFNQIARIAPLLNKGTYISKERASPTPVLPNYNQELTIRKKLTQSLIVHSLRHENFITYAKNNAEYFAATFSSYAKKGTKIIFLFTPISPATRLFEADGEEQIYAVKSVLSKIGQVVDLRNHPDLEEQMFHDIQHIRPEGRRHIWANESVFNTLHQVLCEKK